MDEQKSLDLDPLEELFPPPPLPGELDLLGEPEPEVWPDPPSLTDWLGLQELVAGEVTRVYEGQPAGPALPPLVRYRRELMGWDPERPLAEIRVQCQPRLRPLAIWREAPCCVDGELVGHGTRTVRVRDRRIHNVPTWLEVERYRYRCKTCGRTTADELPDLHPKYRITRRLHRDIALGSVKRPFADVARLQSVDKSLVERIFDEYQSTMLNDYHIDLPPYVGVDETHILGEVCFVCTDLSNGRILDIVRGNSKEIIRDFFAKHSYHFHVRVFCQDMHNPYRQVAKELFPKALIVVDRFHVIQLATFCMDEARKDFAAELPAANRVALSRQAKLFNTNRSNLTPRQLALMKDLRAGSPHLALAHDLKEEFERIYSRTSRAAAEAAFTAWADRLNDPATDRVSRHFRGLVGTIRRWHREVFNYFDAPVTNGFVEGLNRRVKEINRYAHGLSLETLRAKAVLRYGHFHRLGETAAFSVGGSEEAIEAAHQYRIWHGFSADELATSLRVGEF